MCHATTCRVCGKTTWAGCGQHVDQVMRHVPPEQQCTCTAADREAARGSTWLGRLLRR